MIDFPCWAKIKKDNFFGFPVGRLVWVDSKTSEDYYNVMVGMGSLLVASYSIHKDYLQEVK